MRVDLDGVIQSDRAGRVGSQPNEPRHGHQ